MQSSDDKITYDFDETPSRTTNVQTTSFLYNDAKSALKTTVDVNNNLDKTIQDYVKKNSPHVCLLTPCYGSLCYVNYVHCLIQTISLFQKLNIGITVEFCKNDSLVSRARNNLIAKAMSNPSITHMMFVDNDITWDPIDIIKLIISDKSLIGGVYPLKKYNWNTILPTADNPNPVQKIIDRKNNSMLKTMVSDESALQHHLLKYNTNFLENVLNIDNNLTKVRHIATGFMMIKRSTIEKMAKAFPSTKYTDDVGFLHGDENKYAYALFDCGVEDDHYFSEDWLFCHRWTKMGGSVYLDVSINLKHTGIEDFNGSFIASIV
jgi:acyl-CoA synthetase (AMP-forming)/AMP-acid ligase II